MQEMELDNALQRLDPCLLLRFDPHMRGEVSVVSYQSITQLHYVLVSLICCASARLAENSRTVKFRIHIP